jgi:hypothetical protein
MTCGRLGKISTIWIAVGVIVFAQMLAPAGAASMSRCNVSQLAQMGPENVAPYAAALCKAACLAQDTLVGSAATPDLPLDHGVPHALLTVAKRPATITAAFQPGLLQRACSPPFSVLFCSYRE